MLIPKKLQQKVIDYFGGNVNKANLWWGIDNPILNDMKPKNYYAGGNWKRLEKMIDDALKENK